MTKKELFEKMNNLCEEAKVAELGVEEILKIKQLRGKQNKKKA